MLDQEDLLNRDLLSRDIYHSTSDIEIRIEDQM